MICKNCGTKFDKGLRCPQCKTKFTDTSHFATSERIEKLNKITTQNMPQKSKIRTLIELILFGSFGVHRFYTGKKISGFCMLALYIIPKIYASYLSRKPSLYIQGGDYENAATFIEEYTQSVSNFVSFSNLCYWILIIWIGFDLFLILSNLYRDKYGNHLK